MRSLRYGAHAMHTPQTFQVGVFMVFVAAGIWFSVVKAWLPAVVVLVAATSYLSLAMEERDRTGNYEQSVRYVDWAITTPIILAAILHANKWKQSAIAYIVALDVLMIATGYTAMKEHKRGRKSLAYVWFVYGCVLFVPIAVALAKVQSSRAAAIFTLVFWSLYPLVWWASSRGYIVAADYAYGVLDVISKVGFGVLCSQGF